MGRGESLVTFIVVFAAGTFALSRFFSRNDLPFLRGTHLVILLYSVLGVLCNISGDETSGRLDVWVQKNRVLVETVAFPCFVTETWLMYGVIQKEIAWFHVMIGAAPAVAALFDDRHKRKCIDLVVYACCVSLLMVCFQFKNVVGIECAMCFFIGYTIASKDVEVLSRPSETVFNLLIAGFTLLTVSAVT